MSSSFAVLIPTSGSPRDCERLDALLASLARHEPAGGLVLLIEDAGPEAYTSACLTCPPSWTLMSLANPCYTHGIQAMGGLFVGIMHGLAWLHANTSVDLVLKLDTDSFVLAPFRERLSALFSHNKLVGQLGTLGRTCNRLDPTYGFEANYPSPLLRMLPAPGFGQPSGLFIDDADRASLHSFRRVEHHIRRAVANGYSAMTYCQGGAYALAASTLGQLESNGCFEDYANWAPMMVGEDVLMGMCVASIGLESRDHSERNQIFGLDWRGLPFSPIEIVDQGYSLIHSLKCSDEEAERDLRSFFVNR